MNIKKTFAKAALIGLALAGSGSASAYYYEDDVLIAPRQPVCSYQWANIPYYDAWGNYRMKRIRQQSCR